MRTVTLASLLCLAFAAAAPHGLAQGKAGQAKAAHPLTPDQEKKIAEIRSAAVAKAAPLQGELHAKMVDVRQLFTADKPDRKAIIAKQAEMQPIQNKLREVWTDFALQVHGVLTPEQRADWANSGGGMGMCPGMGMGPGHHGPGMHGMMGPGGGGCPLGCPMYLDEQ